ncbi:MAG TPA: hypothetical protein PLD20_04620 [Blastocatellia bacterium]|nr:hypothetical protein [Blastocatellia bacterium]HMZ17191.1 hypothetical protein [Blastocatellia bacterium]HNG31884.1 hypothetical protein [Blastocatellia bacterium]
MVKSLFPFFDLEDVLPNNNFCLNNHQVVDRMRLTFASYSLISLIGNVVGILLGLNGINEFAPKFKDMLMILSGKSVRRE